MGTRNLTIVKNNNEIKVAKYGQWDGYPSGLGNELLEMIKRVGLGRIQSSLDKSVDATQEYIDQVNATEGWSEVYPWLSRDCSGAQFIEFLTVWPGRTLKNIFQEDFAADSLFCEWCYVIDFDTNTFEVYKGFNTSPLTEEDRFFYLESKSTNEYHPVKLKIKYDLNELPDRLMIEDEFEDNNIFFTFDKNRVY